MTRIALIGDYDESVPAHRAVPRALEIAADELAVEVEFDWIRSNDIQISQLQNYAALWCVPLSPYENPQAVIAAIGYARVSDVPFLGTCAGYQHAVLEYARNVLGFEQADSVEDNPATAMPLIIALSCRLSDESDAINLTINSRVKELYQTDRILEEYHCGFGVNPDCLRLFDDSGLNFCGYDDNDEPRVFEIPRHKFFIGTAYQPERSAFSNKSHPIISAFLVAAL